MKKGRKKLDLVGQKFSRLTVIGEAECRGKLQQSFWLCKCDCGKEKIVRGASLKNKNTTSCGCYQKEKVSKPDGVSMFNTFVYRYKHAAKNANRIFDLTEKQIKDIIAKNCHYCGSEPREYIYFRKRYKHKCSITANGLDRIDNNGGYTVDNVAPCCSRCNIMKTNLSQKEFYEHIENIYRYRVELSQIEQY